MTAKKIPKRILFVGWEDGKRQKKVEEDIKEYLKDDFEAVFAFNPLVALFHVSFADLVQKSTVTFVIFERDTLVEYRHGCNYVKSLAQMYLNTVISINLTYGEDDSWANLMKTSEYVAKQGDWEKVFSIINQYLEEKTKEKVKGGK